MFIIVGLGNPGREYAGTRHNAGFMVLDILAERFDIEIKRHNFHAVFGEGFVDGQKVVLVKPETFMNESGRAVREIFAWYKCSPEQLLIIYDDIDIPLGDIRIRGGGSAGTHNGMRSVIYQLCFDSFPRIRVGIGQAQGQRGLIAHVLGAPQGEEKSLFDQGLSQAADGAELIVQGKLLDAQSRFNKRPKKEKPPQQDGNLEMRPRSSESAGAEQPEV